MPEQRQEITDRCIANLQEIVRRLRESGCRVVICAIFPAARFRCYANCGGRRESIADVNRAIRTLDGEAAVAFDAHAILVGEGGRIREEYTIDLLHVNEAAYAALNTALLDRLESRP